MIRVDRRRADIDRIIRHTKEAALSKRKEIRTIDPIVTCTRRLFPYLSDQQLYDYARTALRILINESVNPQRANSPQTTLLAHIT